MRVAPVELAIPPEVLRPCGLATLEGDTLADLEIAYMRRGEQLVVCDGARQLAVETLLRERAIRTSTGW